MNIDKLFNPLTNGCLYDVMQQPLELYDVIYYSNTDGKLKSGLILELIPEDHIIGIEKNSITTGIDWIRSTQILKINDILKAKNIDPKSYITKYKQNLKLNTKNMIYVFYCICDNIDGLIFFKPTYSIQYQKIKQLKEIINQYNDKQFYICPILKTKEWYYHIHLQSPIYINKYFQIIGNKGYYIFSDIFSLNQNKLNKSNIIEFNKFIPISYNRKNNKYIDLLINNNIINISILTGDILYNDLTKFYKDIIPDTLTKYKDGTFNESPIFKDMFSKISKTSIKDFYHD